MLTREQILGEIQALRAVVARVESREHGRSINRRLRTLYEAADYDVALTHVVPFALEARARITQSLGMAGWEQPETLEEAKARMGTLPAAPEPSTYSGVPRPGPFTLTDGTQYPEPPPLLADPGRLLSETDLDAAEAIVRAAYRWTQVGGPNKVASSFDLIMAELRRLRAR